MIAITESEDLFERFCTLKGIRFERVLECKKPTPDYDIFLGHTKIIAEIKQIDPNREDLKAEQELRDNQFTLIGCIPGERVRNKITSASRQIRSRTEGKHPSIIILYNNMFIADHIQPYNIKVAMYGFETYVLEVPKNPTISTALKDKKFGPKRRMTEAHNTSISAIGVLKCDEDGGPYLEVYHNIYAKNPLDISLINKFEISQFRLDVKKQSEFQDWVKI